jgi:putative spermidine/putrescine transport system substrate-binding protein
MVEPERDPSAAIARIERTLRRAMLRDLEAITRRELLRRGGRLAAGAGAASALFAGGFRVGAAQETPVELPEVTEIAENLKGSGEVVVASYGGALQDAQREAYFKPFQELSGITVIEAEGPDISKVKAMVDTGNVEWDVAEFDRSSIINLEQQGDYWEEIDYSLFDTANIPESARYKYSVDMLPYATVIAYRTDVFSEAPHGQKDFWDLEKFAGARSTEAGSGGLTPFLEAAVIADGVPVEEVYPIDIERAYASLSKIKEAVVKFWEAGAQPAQLLTDNEAVMVHAWNGRIAAIQEEGAPAGITWKEGMLQTDVWGIPKGAKNAENAQKFSAFITLPIPQARLSMLIPYGFVNTEAVEYIPAERLAQLPTAPDIKELMFQFNVDWWVENRDAVLERWNEWILE